MPELSELTLADFSPLVGDAFVCRQDAGDVSLVLEAAAGSGRMWDGREGFSLVLSGPVEPMLGQGMYRLVHGSLGSVDLFMVPIGSADDRAQYEIIIT